MLDLYKNIKKRRTELGLSQQQLAELTGYTDRSSIAKIESGNVDLSESKIKKFADVLHISASELMGFPESDESASSSDSQGYYINQETAQVAQKIMENKELGLLFSAASYASPEDLLTVHQMLLALKRKEQSD